MGIQGLLPLLKSIMVPIHIKDLQGCCVAVDTYSWLHKGALSCSKDLCKGQPTTRHIEYCMHRVNLLRHCGVKPILVFDGGLLPMKGEQENKRARIRKENLARAIKHEAEGNSAAAYECYQKAVDISPLIAHELIQVLKLENVSYVVAPYEADAQMTFLAISKQVEAIITEDSDLIPFGCPRIIFKMDKFGQGVEFRSSMLQQNKDLSFAGFTKQMLLEMCILSGCDYLQSLPGMGLKRAHALIKKFKSYDKVVKHLRYSTISVPPQYEESFKKAILTFLHQRVFDPINEGIVHLTDISDNVGDDLDFLGPLLSKQIAKGIAEGDLDPFTKMQFKAENVNVDMVLCETFQHKQFNPDCSRKKLDLPVQKNLLTKYFCFASLEAKRKFRAPRTSPNHPIPDESSPIASEEHITLEAAACKANCLPAAMLDSQNMGTVCLADNPVEDGFGTEIPELSESPSHDMGCDTRILEQTLLQPSYSIHKPCKTLHKEHECKDVPDPVEGKTRTVSRNVVVRSRYFQHKSENQEDPNKQEQVHGDEVVNLYENAVAESPSLTNNHLKDTVTKRKTFSDEWSQKENVRPKHRRTEAPPPNNGDSVPDFNKTSKDTPSEEGKFGSNISHLNHYSEIAEKSMEKFVSVISSFRYSSSGSRASGLRAPMKDVRNTCTNRRPTIGMDFSQFAYVPNNGKTKRASRRG